MIYPKLVRNPQIPCTVVLYAEGISEEGAPIMTSQLSLKCDFQEKAYTKMTEEQKTVNLNGRAFFDGDIYPSLPVICGGTMRINGIKRTIYAGQKAHNPDGTVNFTMLEVI